MGIIAAAGVTKQAFHIGAGVLRIRDGGDDERGGNQRIYDGVHRATNGFARSGDARHVAHDSSLQRTIESDVRAGVGNGSVGGDFVVVDFNVEEQEICGGVGIYGCILGPVTIVLVGSGHVKLGVHGFGMIVVAESIWYVIVGVMLMRMQEEN